MPLTIIVKSKLKSRGRSDTEKMLRKEGWGQTLTDEQLDKCEFIERMVKKEGADRTTCLRAHQIDALE
jgi:hypothetical protein